MDRKQAILRQQEMQNDICIAKEAEKRHKKTVPQNRQGGNGFSVLACLLYFGNFANFVRRPEKKFMG